MSSKARRRGQEADQKNLAKEMAELKRENARLKRMVARLQKSVTRLESEKIYDEEEEVEEQKTGEKQAVKEPVKDKCKCGSTNLNIFSTPAGKRLIVCKDCKARHFT